MLPPYVVACARLETYTGYYQAIYPFCKEIFNHSTGAPSIKVNYLPANKINSPQSYIQMVSDKIFLHCYTQKNQQAVLLAAV